MIQANTWKLISYSVCSWSTICLSGCLAYNWLRGYEPISQIVPRDVRLTGHQSMGWYISRHRWFTTTNMNSSAKYLLYCRKNNPDSKVHGANMGPTWGRQDPGGPHVGPMSFALWEPAILSNLPPDLGPLFITAKEWLTLWFDTYRTTYIFSCGIYMLVDTKSSDNDLNRSKANAIHGMSSWPKFEIMEPRQNGRHLAIDFSYSFSWMKMNIV